MNEEYNEALEWAANWITGAQMLGRGKEVEKFAHDMAMSIRAAKRPTPRAVDGANATVTERYDGEGKLLERVVVYQRPATNA